MKAIFFDWDGTLVDSLPLLYAAHNHVREVMGEKTWSMEEYRLAIVYSTRELYPKIYGERAGVAQDILYKFIYENHLEQLELLDGASEMITEFSARGVPMGVVSNKRDDVLKREVEHLGWDKYFGVYIGAGVAAKDKPSGEPLRHAVARHPAGVSMADVLYVGDTESDLGCGADAPCPVAYIRHDVLRPDLVERYKPLYVVNNVRELKDKLIEYLDKAL